MLLLSPKFSHTTSILTASKLMNVLTISFCLLRTKSLPLLNLTTSVIWYLFSRLAPWFSSRLRRYKNYLFTYLLTYLLIRSSFLFTVSRPPSSSSLKSQIAHFDMHHLAFGINFLLHSVNLIRSNHSSYHFSHPNHLSSSPIIGVIVHYSYSFPL